MKTDYLHIKELLDKFYAGTTTSDEEDILSVFFNSPSTVPEEFKADMKVFKALEEGMENTIVPDNLEEKIISAIDSESQIEMSKQFTVPPISHKFRRKALYIISAAAVIAIILIIPFISDISEDMHKEKDLIALSDTISKQSYSDTNGIVSEIANTSSELYSQDNSNSKDDIADNVSSKGSIIKSAKTSAPEYKRNSSASSTADGNEITLSEEEMEAINLGLSVLAKVGKQLAYTQERIETTDMAVEKSLSEIRNTLDK